MRVKANTDFMFIGRGDFKKGFEYEVEDITGMENLVTVIQPEVLEESFDEEEYTPEEEKEEDVDV